ncbi:MAG: nitroreductase family protein, partial [Oscillospiraceae bacterium]|nr:nitroreductase family protein [Oscillospiraceae bacterium]
MDEIFRRRSIRAYRKGAKVSGEDVEKLLKAAMAAPSACNTQPWGFIVVDDEAGLLEIADA